MLQPTVDACPAPVTPPSTARRLTSFFFLLCPLQSVTHFPFRFSYLSIRRSDRYDFVSKVLDHVTGYVLVFFFFFVIFCLTIGRVKSVRSSLTILRRFSDLCLRVEVSAKLLHRSDVELFLGEYFSILGLDSHRKSSNMRNVVKNRTS